MASGCARATNSAVRPGRPPSALITLNDEEAVGASAGVVAARIGVGDGVGAVDGARLGVLVGELVRTEFEPCEHATTKKSETATLIASKSRCATTPCHS